MPQAYNKPEAQGALSRKSEETETTEWIEDSVELQAHDMRKMETKKMREKRVKEREACCVLCVWIGYKKTTVAGSRSVVFAENLKLEIIGK